MEAAAIEVSEVPAVTGTIERAPVKLVAIDGKMYTVPDWVITDILDKGKPFEPAAAQEAGIVKAEAITIPARQEYETSGVAIKAEAETTEITDQGTYDYVLGIVKRARAFAEQVHNAYDKICNAAFALHKLSTTTRGNYLKPFEDADKIGSAKIKAWDKKIREEKQAEADRQAREAAAKAEDDRLAKAEELEAKGETAEATRELERPIAIQTAQVKVEGSSSATGYRAHWKARVINFSKLADPYKIANQELLDGLARMQKGKNPPEGVEFYDDSTLIIK